ncbi:MULTISPECIES: tetratricopeptide repeat protein [unclassified Planococcus (in: firmicutes)]|uniref:tetratricopeptide repeat protein n=1 Tax=Planococcus TaxID=1372 RepID=UPI000C7DC02A|nr:MULTISPECIES: tetratricopeptide repeat protein [unclassified Planococcus (in: firmicutes)]PKG48354.1 transcriptional regulator [Planococcus sp. Urea-trap-24]PKG92201.1 transcriptional regulator [Planococcus sp. Urea-3u-39]PKH42893.1 transcriptional regulator [Planococcus sp. MB-3u-09]
MDTGMRLKYHRLKKRFSMEETASGIFSPKDLKKIEAGLKEPALKDLEALCKKLEIPLAAKDNPIGKVLVKNFKNSLLHPQNKGKIMEHYADICNHPLLRADEDVELEFDIQQIRYFIITGDLESAEKKIKEMDRFKEFMDQEQYYLYHKYNGNYNYILNDYENALKTYLIAERIAPKSISPAELGDLYYSIGISSTKCEEHELSYKYSEMALKIYQQEFVPKRIVECHLNIAITHEQFGNHRLSMEHYKNALTIGSKLDIDILKFTTEYNLGFSYFIYQQYELAIPHLNNSLKYIPDEYIADSISAHCVLIKSHLELGDKSKAKEIAAVGQQLVKAKELRIDSPSNDIFKDAYMEFIALTYLLDDEDDKFEEIILNKLINSFTNSNSPHDLGYYLGYLGKMYFRQGRYKESAEITEKSRDAYKEVLNIKWE